LPEPVLAVLREVAHGTEKITVALATRLDREFHIAIRFGVSRPRIRAYIERLRQAGPEVEKPDEVDDEHGGDESDKDGSADRSWDVEPVVETKERSTAAAEDGCDTYVANLDEHRQRQNGVATILDKTLHESARDRPELWDRRAYLMLVGLVYDRLCADDVSTDEVVKLAKALAQNRRVEARALKYGAVAAGGGYACTAPTDELPENFADAIRQVYGVKFESADGA